MSRREKTTGTVDTTAADKESGATENDSVLREKLPIFGPVSPSVSPESPPIRRNKRGQVLDSEAARALGHRTMFGPGNEQAVTHGLYSRAAEAHAEIAATLDRYVSDEGGLSEVMARRLDLLSNRAKLQRQFDRLSDALDALGLFDRRGRLRASWLQRLEGLANVLVRLDATLGLTRRAKTVTLADIIEQHERSKGLEEGQDAPERGDRAEEQG